MTLPAGHLPIHDVLPELLDALESGREAVLQAPPGAGKTTIVPLALLNAQWTGDAKIIVLEPRRLAARAAARRMAQLLGQPVGATVGYRVRMDTRVGPRTRIEVVTEGVLTRMLQSDPSLDGVAAVLFDEFHERSLQADLGLALTLDARSAFRDDLRVIVMSATLDGERVAQVLGGAPLVTSEGRLHPVDISYLDRTPAGRTEDTTASAIRQALAESEGDLLVFLPGAGEIRRTAERLDGLGPDVDVRLLFGALSFEDQDRAIRPSPAGRRKVVLSTDIAETSLTIEGIRTVVDSGLVRGPLFDASSGMTRLVTRPTSRASADQRAGRAGRLGPGRCIRLWTQVDQAARADFAEPEIRQVDLTPLALDLAVWGVRDPADLKWLDPPESQAYSAAVHLLQQLDALDEEGAVTSLGRSMNTFGLHPRLARMLVDAPDDDGPTACALAALLEERDPLQRSAVPAPIDAGLRVHLLADGSTPPSVQGARVDGGAVRRASRMARELERKVGTRGRVQPEATARTLALAYPDRIAQWVRDGHFRLRNGRPVTVPESDPLAAAPFLAVGPVGGVREGHRVFMGAAISEEEIRSLFRRHIEESREARWDSSSDAARTVRQERLGAVVLSEGPVADPDREKEARLLLREAASRGLHVLPWNKELRQLQERLVFLRARDDSWPNRSDEAILESLEEWLLPFAMGMSRLSDLRKLDMHRALLAGLSWDRRQELDRRAPTHRVVPSGSRIPVDYSDPASPVLAVRLQEVFGLTETPRVDGVPLTMHLLSPAHRPVQVTQDLQGFWESSYFDVRKDMRGRYPKHYWPENPLEATPTNRAKPRR